ncbi:hypothetical protein CS379_17065 [Methylobacterium frigidaeris]|uniref:Uncharacterized protein n=1 Tax=Methylobacterium frigidaeris TaxID=2038277 RepID=A0AA37HHJ6_9HYPH|nr:hypothetical protein CS379_17065 [Methylobacterium frigidaeris]GJD65691.1 hypothetical protein MPEAHAMD_5886 [Methylobacterium frigidaeris]
MPMKVVTPPRRAVLAGAAILIAAPSAPVMSAAEADPLNAWNEGRAKREITVFVGRVTTPGTQDYVAPAGRIAVFGRRPILAFGNSDGDLQMLQWSAGGSGPRFLGLVHHTDAEREFAYDRQSPFGRLDDALDEADRRGWVVVDMARDWKTVFPAARPEGR